MDEDDRALIKISCEVGMMDFLLWLHRKSQLLFLPKELESNLMLPLY